MKAPATKAMMYLTTVGIRSYRAWRLLRSGMSVGFEKAALGHLKARNENSGISGDTWAFVELRVCHECVVVERA